MTLFSRSRLRFVCVVAAALSVVGAARGRSQELPTTSSANSSRPELEAMAARLEQDAMSGSLTKEVRQARLAEAQTIRQRLADGDFSVGDRIVVTLLGDSLRSDTLVVQAGKRLTLRSLPEVSLAGVLRSELRPRLMEHVGKYLRNPQILVTPLIRLSVLGEVQRPGFYPISADLLVSDAIMAAGGPSQSADLAKTVVMRSGHQVMSDRDVRTAVQAGRTLDQLNLREGDEIVVGKRPQRNWNLVIAFATAGVALLSTLSALSRH